MNEQPDDELERYGGTAGGEGLSLLQAFDLAVASISPHDPLRREFLALREAIADQEEMIGDARQMIEKLEEVIKKVTSPANRIGTFLGNPSRDTAHIVVGGSDYYCNVDPRLSISKLKKGTRVLVNEAYVVVGDLGFETGGPVTKITEVLGTDRLRVGGEHGMQSTVLQRSAELAKSTLKSGDEVRVDPSYRMALEAMSHPESRDHYLDVVPELPWEKVGGQDEALQAIKDAIELPLIHGELFQKFQHATPKGFLLYGPPGCGKTLIGKATAYNLTKQLREKTGHEMKEYFMHVKGPEILNMWVGESERIVRDIFATAREKRREGFLPFLFIDEAESILGTRRASRHSNILSTLVPMFCSEMDGIDSLDDVVIILASNRADLIDPAILRPGRIDRKIKVQRPNRVGAREIYRIYLTDALPYAASVTRDASSTGEAINGLIDRLLEAQFARRDENKFLEITLRSGRKEMVYRSDLLSGAIIASIVERAKGRAIKRAIASSGASSSADGADGITEEDLQFAFHAEFSENDIFPPADITEDWFKLIDYDPENVVKIAPARAAEQKSRPPSAVI
ncbi:MAG: Bacterial proteasome-activating AAA-ATPase (PAN) [uncultured Chthoniobacterales bacterium]|uniref:Bacterial proteasome-activating AAA-ATPase (PAN) n=1 Tax=uncultured Chthoniobacterales bacterium TaxID=1836801 RepID=A0A6J4H0Y1_9BACT|nr:MAG: Bacterial proteasome-activating AAA-ATPase (PAN) [uncultured Chthoniobacterales bacterium]